MDSNFSVYEVGPLDALDQYAFNIEALNATVLGKKFLQKDLGLTSTEISFNKFPPGAAMPFYHRHREHEEVYIFLKGKGQFQVDGKIIDVGAGTTIRVAPSGVRIWRNNSNEDLYFLVIQAKANSFPKSTIEDGVVVDQRINWEA